MKPSDNQVTLARIFTDNALSQMRQRVVLSPQQQLLHALEEAIEDKRGALNELPVGGVDTWQPLLRLSAGKKLADKSLD